MDLKNLYAVGTKIWIRCLVKVWQTAEIIEASVGHKLTVRKNNGEDQVIEISSDEDLPPIQNPAEQIRLKNQTFLSYLHEPAILYNLYSRFQNDEIYTYCGIVLVAINPYKYLDIYGIDTMMAYRGQTMGSLDPHVFGVAEEAFHKMEIENHNQSIIVSGESGAGKTISVNYVMRYFATINGSETENEIEKKVLASSPIIEAFGNAKTTRNDNSSRFGKYIELHFNENKQITGASMQTYLLEKSRVVHQAVDERNYHIFYQLCSSRETFPHLQLGDSEEYLYLGSQPSSDNDRQSFFETVNALNTLGFSQEDQDLMWKVLASILHLGNIEITDKTQKNPGDSDSCYISLKDPSLQIVSTLLDINKGELQKRLCYRRIVSMKETYEKPMTAVEASTYRDALAKHLYVKLFQWLISIMNRTMCETSPSTNCLKIGILDICGFENFELNSFEQFCINYANEKLQQQFNSHVFKIQKDEYRKEGVECRNINFYDNQPCIDLIESKLGIIDLLDEQCRMPQGSDASWTQQLNTECTKWGSFSKPKSDAGRTFTIKHFAGDIKYFTDGFLDKNKDTVLEDQVNVLKNGKNSMLRAIFTVESSSIGANTHSKQNKKTVGSQFKDSLDALMTTLNDTTPHYIKCVKPNYNKLPRVFDHQRAVDQLRACSVLETIRISAAGFPSKWTYVDFFLRYRVLLKSQKIDRNNFKLTCERIVEEHIKNEDNFKFGLSKIFFRADQVEYLERKRSERLTDCSIYIQKNWRKYICRKKYVQIRISVLLIQRYGRGCLDRRLATDLRETKVDTKITKIQNLESQNNDKNKNNMMLQKIKELKQQLLEQKKITEDMVESCNEKCKNNEQKLLEAQNVIATLESKILYFITSHPIASSTQDQTRIPVLDSGRQLTVPVPQPRQRLPVPLPVPLPRKTAAASVDVENKIEYKVVGVEVKKYICNLCKHTTEYKTLASLRSHQRRIHNWKAKR